MSASNAPGGAGGMASTAAPPWRQPLHIQIAVLFTLLIAATGALIGWFNYGNHRAITLAATDDLFQRSAREAMGSLERLAAPIETLLDALSRGRLSAARRFEERMVVLPVIVQALGRNPQLSAFYAGYADGDFFLVRPLREAAARARFKAPAQAAYLVQSIEAEAGARQARFLFLDTSLGVLAERVPENYDFDPRTRPWYVMARDTDKIIRTDPYLFFTTHEVGKTLARRGEGDWAVLGADVTLADISHLLARQKISPGAHVVVFEASGRVVAFDEPARLVIGEASGKPMLASLGELGEPVMQQVEAAFRRGGIDRPLSLEVDGREWKGVIKTMPLAGERERQYMALAAPLDELLAQARRLQLESLLLTAAIVLVSIAIAWAIARLISRSLGSLTRQAKEIQALRFAGGDRPRSFVTEVDQLGAAMDGMRGTIRSFLEITSQLAAETRFERLLEYVLAESADKARAQGGAIYLAGERGALIPAAVHWRFPDGPRPDQLPVLADEPDAPVGPVRTAARTGRTTVAGLRGTLALRGIESLAAACREDGTLIAVPLSNRKGESIGVLCLVRAGQEAPRREELAFVEALSGAAAVAIDNQRLLKAQKDLLEAFIRLVAQAIDAKSPYTGGHCQRVPELTKMLARAAVETRKGPYRDFTLSDEQWEALHIACWLHDCGKVTTPEYVVDKATKLETLYDRIHEVRMRFEVLKRDADIAYWRGLAGGGEATLLNARRDAELAALDADFAFVAACNEGGEYLAPDKVERLKVIARRTWMRTLDERLGVSHEEKARMQRSPARALPAEEPLLADKPEHIIERSAAETIAEDNPWGFKLKAPRYKYHRGELHNLSIGRGTLTDEDRYKINDHIVQTIIMLSQLPFPAHLKDVPEIAGGHHEKMDGTGYPRRLTREQMSPLARMMAIADIFEALTAVDRPYKKGKLLSETLAIMARMRKERHVDPDLFDLFLKAGIWRDYAQRFMKPEQIDEVDIGPLLAAA